MMIALLFDWTRYPQSGNYWHAIRRAVFAPGIVQRSGRHMKLSVGDVLVGIERGQDPEKLFDALFNNSEFSLFYEDRLQKGFPTIFGMVFENMPRELAAELHDALRAHKGYVGAFSVHLHYGPHLALYRNRLLPEYRLEGTRLRGFYSMGNLDGCDDGDLKQMRRYGYRDIGWEDTGASRTILDDYDTSRHFERVAAFRSLLAEALPGGEDGAHQLVMLLEDVNPRLFNALGAAAERLRDAETEEEIAQVALSGRRYLEQLADTLFPATEFKRGKRVLDRAAYRNRLWAFVEDRTVGDETTLLTMGREVDRVVSEMNAGLHADRPKMQIAKALVDASTLTANLFALNPEPVRDGYLAYSGALRAFVRDLIAQRDGVDA